MRILVLENAPSSQLGGQEFSLLDTCRGLAGRGHEISLVYREEGDLLAEYERFAVTLTQVQTYTIDRRRTVRSIAQWFGSLSRALLHRTDIVYVNQYHDTLLGGALAKLWRRPLVCHLRLMPPEPLCGQFRLGRSLVTRFIANSCAVCDRYIAAGYPPEKFDVVYNGIDLGRFSPSGDGARLRDQLGIPREAFAVLFVGRFDRQKGIEVLLRAFARLPATAWLVLAGSPVVHATEAAALEYVRGLQTLAEELGVAERVLWVGRRSDLPELYAACDVLVLPNEVDESFGRVLAEAMACGTPAVGSRVGGIPEVLAGEFQRFVVAPGDDADLARVLLSLSDWRISDPGLALRSRQHVETRFPLEAMVSGVEQSLRRALAHR